MLTDIVTPNGEPGLMEMSRPDTAIEDIVVQGPNNTERPLIVAGGGSGGEYGYAYV